jgi:hypothetical protein
MTENRWMQLPQGGAGSKWFNSPVVCSNGSLHAIHESIPDFERRSLGLTQQDLPLSCINQRLDLIVRKPCNGDPHSIPIGVVSKEYQLVTHREVVEATIHALEENDIHDASAGVSLTEYGERMNLSVYLPKKFQFDPGDGHPISMRLECFNSVDGSSRFKAFIGWFRFICSNGLILGVTRTNFQHRHIGSLSIADIGTVLKSGFEDAPEEKENLMEWAKKAVPGQALIPWVEDTVRETWGFKAATRVYQIARTGHDVEIAGTYKDYRPTTIPVRLIGLVPGTHGRAETVYDVSQVLAWLAKERNDLQEQLEWREQIPGMMKRLMN